MFRAPPPASPLMCHPSTMETRISWTIQQIQIKHIFSPQMKKRLQIIHFKPSLNNGRQRVSSQGLPRHTSCYWHYSLLEFTRATSIDQLLVRRVITVQFTVIYYQGMKWYRQLFITVLSTQIWSELLCVWQTVVVGCTERQDVMMTASITDRFLIRARIKMLLVSDPR